MRKNCFSEAPPTRVWKVNLPAPNLHADGIETVVSALTVCLGRYKGVFFTLNGTDRRDELLHKAKGIIHSLTLQSTVQMVGPPPGTHHELRVWFPKVKKEDVLLPRAQIILESFGCNIEGFPFGVPEAGTYRP